MNKTILLDNTADTDDNSHTVIGIVLGHRLVRGDAKTLTETLRAQQIPYPLSLHFKRIDSVGELFESMPLDYVRQCIEQTALSPFERAAMLALLENTEIEQ